MAVRLSPQPLAVGIEEVEVRLSNITPHRAVPGGVRQGGARARTKFASRSFNESRLVQAVWRPQTARDSSLKALVGDVIVFELVHVVRDRTGCKELGLIPRKRRCTAAKMDTGREVIHRRTNSEQITSLTSPVLVVAWVVGINQSGLQLPNDGVLNGTTRLRLPGRVRAPVDVQARLGSAEVDEEPTIVIAEGTADEGRGLEETFHRPAFLVKNLPLAHIVFQEVVHVARLVVSFRVFVHEPPRVVQALEHDGRQRVSPRRVVHNSKQDLSAPLLPPTTPEGIGNGRAHAVEGLGAGDVP